MRWEAGLEGEPGRPLGALRLGDRQGGGDSGHFSIWGPCCSLRNGCAGTRIWRGASPEAVEGEGESQSQAGLPRSPEAPGQHTGRDLDEADPQLEPQDQPVIQAAEGPARGSGQATLAAGPLEAEEPQPAPPRTGGLQSRDDPAGQHGEGWRGWDPDLDDSDAHTHAKDDAQVLLQPGLHLLHAALQVENTATSPHDGPLHPITQNPQEGPPPAWRASREGSGCSLNGDIDEYTDERARGTEGLNPLCTEPSPTRQPSRTSLYTGHSSGLLLLWVPLPTGASQKPVWGEMLLLSLLLFLQEQG